jgi:imidazolonepropionase-like amidohydrolase
MIRKLGEISQGAFADISTVKEDPLTDITALEHVGFVMKDGRVFKQKTGSSAGN